MARQRLINCEFVNASSFKVNVSNRAKLLYLMMITNGDDRGFVDSVQDLINALTNNEKEFDNTISLELLENTYNSALQELLDKGYIYEFKDSHSNRVYLIRHWFYHNKYKTGLWTNYKSFFEQVHLENNEYVMGKKPLKEDKLKETNINKNKPNQEEETGMTDKEVDELFNYFDNNKKEKEDEED